MFFAFDENGEPLEEHWEPDNHSLGLLYKMGNTFESAFELARVHFNNANLNIYLYSSNGDEARLDKIEGVTVAHAQ